MTMGVFIGNIEGKQAGPSEPSWGMRRRRRLRPLVCLQRGSGSGGQRPPPSHATPLCPTHPHGPTVPATGLPRDCSPCTLTYVYAHVCARMHRSDGR